MTSESASANHNIRNATEDNGAWLNDLDDLAALGRRLLQELYLHLETRRDIENGQMNAPYPKG